MLVLFFIFFIFFYVYVFYLVIREYKKVNMNVNHFADSNGIDEELRKANAVVLAFAMMGLRHLKD